MGRGGAGYKMVRSNCSDQISYPASWSESLDMAPLCKTMSACIYTLYTVETHSTDQTILWLERNFLTIFIFEFASLIMTNMNIV